MPADNSSNFTLGIKKLSSKVVLGAALSSSKGSITLNALFSTHPGKQEENLIEKWARSHTLISALAPTELLIRQLELPLIKRKEIDQILRFQVEPLLPYPIEDAELDRILHETKSSGSPLTFVAVKKQSIESHLQELKEIKVDPELIGAEPVSLAAFTKFITQSPYPLFSIYIDEEATIVIASKGGNLIASHTFQMGVDEACSPLFKMRIAQQIMSLTKQLAIPLMRQILILSVKPLDSYDFLLPENCSSIPIAKIQDFDSFTLQRFALAIGSAINGLSETKGSVNFRKNGFSYSNPWKRFKLSLYAYYGASLLLSLSIFILNQSYFSHREASLKQQWVDQLVLMGKDPTSVEAKFQEKFGFSEQEESRAPTVDEYTLKDLLSRIEFIQKEIQSTPNLFALHPNIPRVSDLLAYLATHPQITYDNSEKDKVKLIHLSYQMVKRPDMAKKQEKYQIKVDMEFTTDIPKLARELHDALIAPNEFIDLKNEIKWSTNRGSYKASFYLKDKTTYPT